MISSIRGIASGMIWANRGYRSSKNEALLRERMLVSRIHEKKPPHLPMPVRTATANARKSAVRAHNNMRRLLGRGRRAALL